MLMRNGSSANRQGFTLFELCIVLVISGLMTSYLIQISELAASRECYATTRTQLHAIREAIENFARNHDRLPLPAARNIGTEDPHFGREVTPAQIAGGAIDQSAGTSWGALPFQALGLSTQHAGDCWGNKISYVVTTALTTNASVGGFRDNSVLGNIAIKSSITNTLSPNGAYAIISHGEDELGAVKLNYSGIEHGWCSGSDMRELNCNRSSAVVANSLLDGDIGSTYFDDLVSAADKPKIFIPKSNALCWGSNSSGQMGDATTANRTALTSVHGAQSYTSLTSGYDFSCGLSALGEAWCRGINTSGQLGDGTTTTRLEAVKVSGTGSDPLSLIALAAGYNHACGINVTGDAYCWGDNNMGQLGNGTTTASSTPVKALGGQAFTRIAAGNGRTCALTATNALYCWGENASGGLGVTIGSKTSPTLVSSGPWLAVSMHAESRTQCAITSSGAAYCWGAGSNGELGNNTVTANSNSLAAVSGGLTFKSLAVGGAHVCGLTSAGATYCWGTGSNGIVGNPAAAAAQRTPLAVVGGRVFSEISAGSNHTCGHEAGAIYCWGVNSSANLGDGTTTNSSTPVQVSATGSGPYVMGSITTGNAYSCALAPANRSYCWNDNGNGQIGDGTNVSKAAPTLVSAAPPFTSIIRTNAFSCGLTAANAAWCWGRNANGQLGIGTTTASSVPVAVNGSYRFSKLSSGDSLTCGLTTAGAAYCWGLNSAGQLGVGNSTSTNAPATRAGSATYRDIVAAPDHTCGIRDNGSADCWGEQLNLIGISIYLNSPSPILSSGTFTSIAAGNNFTCGLRDDGQVLCWGTNLYGAMGRGLPGGLNILALPVLGGQTFRQITAGNNHMCGLNQNGYPYCWGDNSKGQSGNGTSFSLFTLPTAVLVDGLTPTPFARIEAGSESTCAYTANGKAYCWGNLMGTNVYYPTLVDNTGTAPLIFGKGSQGASCAVAP